MKRVPFFLITFLLLSSCARFFTPSHDFDYYTTPSAPDYSKDDFWCTLPWKKDSADVVPKNSGLKNMQDSAKVDVFFIHPTTYYSKKTWNAPLDDEKANWFRDLGPIMRQASVFNGSCRIFAPVYRQATLGTFFQPEGSINQQKSIELARQDVFTAFEYYLKHYNQGRPFIIASHSQGTYHAIELIKKYIDGKDLGKQFIAGYLIGGMVKKDSFTHLKIMNSSTETGGIVCWRTMKNKFRVRHAAEKRNKNFANVNPLTWTTDENWAGPQEHLGSVPSSFARIDKNLVSARVAGDFLLVKKILRRGYRSRLGANYHLYDYSLFYMNIRANAQQRIEAWLEKNK